MLAYRQFGGEVGRNAPTETAFSHRDAQFHFLPGGVRRSSPNETSGIPGGRENECGDEIVHLSLDLAGEARILLG